MAKIKILFVIEAMQAGGAERQLSELISGLDPKQFDVKLLTWTKKNFFDDFNGQTVEWYKLSRKHKFDFRPALKIGALLNQHKVDLIHSFLDTGNLYAVLASKLTGKGIVVASERSTQRKMSFFQSLHKPWSHKNADLTIVNSDAGRDYLLQLGIKDHKLVCIHNGIDIDKFHPVSQTEKTRLKKELNLNPKKKLMLCVGRIFSTKNQLGIIEAFARSRIRNNYGLLFIGSSNEVYLEDLKIKIKHEKLNDVILVKNTQIHIERYYSAAEVLVLFSNREGTPNVILEAMSSGIPVISSRVGDVPKIIEQGVNGWTVGKDDIEALVETFNYLSNAPNTKLTDMGSKGREMIFEMGLDKESMVNKFQKVYKDLVIERDLVKDRVG